LSRFFIEVFTFTKKNLAFSQGFLRSLPYGKKSGIFSPTHTFLNFSGVAFAGVSTSAVSCSAAFSVSAVRLSFKTAEVSSKAVSAFAAALAAPEGGYPTYAYGAEEPWPVCLFSTVHSLEAAE
jgi:hypothetical protein